MRILIVEDDYITGQVMMEIASAFGPADVAEDGFKAFELFTKALNEKDTYDVIFLDIMMPDIDGQEVLTKIREIEAGNGIKGLDCTKIIMTTALDDFQNINSAFKNQAEGYIVKPVNTDKFVNSLIKLGLIE